MPRRVLAHTVVLSLLCGLLFMPAASPSIAAQSGHRYSQHNSNSSQKDQRKEKSQQQNGNQQMSAQQAAAKAQARHGGRVLKVVPRGNGYNVRLLKDDGRVISVFIGD